MGHNREEGLQAAVYAGRGVGGGGTLGLFGWRCVTGTMEPLAYTRATSAEFSYPTLIKSPPYPIAAFRLSCTNLNLSI